MYNLIKYNFKIILKTNFLEINLNRQEYKIFNKVVLHVVTYALLTCGVWKNKVINRSYKNSFFKVN